jgi:hypothetical protein
MHTVTLPCHPVLVSGYLNRWSCEWLLSRTVCLGTDNGGCRWPDCGKRHDSYRCIYSFPLWQREVVGRVVMFERFLSKDNALFNTFPDKSPSWDVSGVVNLLGSCPKSKGVNIEINVLLEHRSAVTFVLCLATDKPLWLPVWFSCPVLLQVSYLGLIIRGRV